MKRVILFLGSILWMMNLSAQVIFSEYFTGIANNSLPANWQVSSNTDVHTYNRPLADCITDKGLQTPSVGKTAPVRLILPDLTFDASNGDISISFKVFVMDANLNCASAKDTFPCPTFVTAYLIKSTYAGGTNALPTGANVYSQQSYRIRVANGNNTIIFHQPSIPDGGTYKIYLDFKTADNTNCTSSGTKFVFDDFVVEKSSCTTDCPPVANDDYFDGSRQQFVNTLHANVYGGFLVWASEVPAGYEMQSLSLSPASNSGLDYDVNNHPLSQMQFVLVSGPTLINSQGCPSPAPVGTLNFHSDGTFEYIRTNVCISRVSFQYKIIDPTALQSNVATVTIDLTPNSPLPVNFTSFNGQRNGTTVLLKWQTGSEKNCSGFFVQRNTGSGWANQGFVFSSANGQSGSALNYEFHETNTFTGNTQYRLAEQDLDGSIMYSEIIVVKGTEASGNIVVYPNPSTTGSVTVLMPQLSVYNISLYNRAGAKEREWNKVNNDALSINSLRTGIYLLRVSDLIGGKTYTARLIVTQ